MIDNSADYCPTCGQPRERLPADVECGGLTLTSDNRLLFHGEPTRLNRGPAKFLRTIMEKKGRASHEYIILRVSPEMESNIIQVYACRLRKVLDELTHGSVQLMTVRGWGYEICGEQAA